MIIKKALGVAILILLTIGPGGFVICQQQAIPVAILTFQDDTATNVSSAVGPGLARDLHQKLATSARDLLPRLITDTNAEAVRGLTIEQLATLGKQRGAMFVVRGGILAIGTSAAGSDTNVTVQLYADLISADTSTVVGTVRAEGTGTQSGAMPPLAAIGPRSDQFSASGLGQALGAAITQLADAVRQTIATAATAPNSNATQTVSQTTTQPDADSDAAKTAEADSELQQLIAQAESLISSGASTSTESVAAVSQALSALKASLATKASLMEKNQDLTAADQEVATQGQALQAALAQAATEAAATTTTSVTDSTQQPSAQKKSFMDKIGSFADEALSLLQKIQQIRSTLQSFNDSSAPPTTGAGNSSATDSSANANNGVSTDQPLGEVTGVVTDQNGGPVAGADVSEQTSGASTVTNSSGQYDLNGLLPNQLAAVVVKASDKVLNGQAMIVSGHPVTLDFQFKADGAGSQSQGKVLPSTVILRARAGGVNQGILKGVVQDARGVPVPRALVTLQGLAIARTNSLGQYQFVNVPTGLQQLSINQPGTRTRFEKVQVATSNNEVKTRFAPGDKQNSPSARSTLRLSSGGATLTGSIVDEANRPLAEVRITAIRDQSAVTASANSSGSFELHNLKPGVYRLVALKAGYDTSVLNVTLSPAGGAPVKFQLKQSNSPLASALLRHPAPRLCVIQGRVLAPGGGAIVSAIVSIKSTAGSTATTIRTNQNGEFRFSLPEGQYEIRVGHDSYGAVSRLVEAKSGGTMQSDFQLQPNKVLLNNNRTQGSQIPSSLSASPVRTGGVVVQVVDARTKLPIAGATISFGQQQAATNANGGVSLASLAPGNYQVTVARTGYLPIQRVLSIIAGETARLNVALTPQPGSPQVIRRN